MTATGSPKLGGKRDPRVAEPRPLRPYRRPLLSQMHRQRGAVEMETMDLAMEFSRAWSPSRRCVEHVFGTGWSLDSSTDSRLGAFPLT